jgi:hypothetical protein
MIYGVPKITRVNDVVDKIGIRTLILSQIWQPSASDLTQDQIDAETPDVPVVSAASLLLIGEQTLPFGGCYRTLWTFEGIKGNGKTVTFKGRDNSLDYDFQPGFSQISIVLKNNFQALLTRYGGVVQDDGTVIWPAALDGSTGTGGLALPSQSSDTNPMFGIQDFFRMEGTYQHRYAALDLPGNLYQNAGIAVETNALPGQPPATSNGRNWLCVPPIYRRRGVIFEITEPYWLSGDGGWPKPVYSRNIG